MYRILEHHTAEQAASIRIHNKLCERVSAAAIREGIQSEAYRKASSLAKAHRRQLVRTNTVAF